MCKKLRATFSQKLFSKKDEFQPTKKLTEKLSLKNDDRASLVAQWLRICLLMQGTRARALVWEDPTCPEQLGPWATTTEPVRLEPVRRNKRGHDSERPAHHNEEWPPLAATRESPSTETKTQHSNQSINQSINLKKKKKRMMTVTKSI